MNKLVGKREDGFIVSYATFGDFKKLKKLVKELSPQSKCHFTPWLFQEKPNIEVRIGQMFGKFSLLYPLGSIIKKIFPHGYSIILKVESPTFEVVGFVYLYNFKKLSNGNFHATYGNVISDQYQGKGLGRFQHQQLQEVIKNHNVEFVEANVYLDNKRNIELLQKSGFKTEKIEKNVFQPCGKRHDVCKLVKKYF